MERQLPNSTRAEHRPIPSVAAYRVGDDGTAWSCRVFNRWSGEEGAWRQLTPQPRRGYRPGLQIDRINNDGNYCPSNCQWVQPVVNVRNNTNTKLDAEKVVAIRKWLRDRRPQREIARMFGVGPTTISHIATGQAWSDIT